jgi:hypothetical protein
MPKNDGGGKAKGGSIEQTQVYAQMSAWVESGE